MDKPPITLIPGHTDLATLRRIYENPVSLSLDNATKEAIQASQDTVQAILRKGETAYGVNTGFGLLAQTEISGDQLAKLQRNLVLSHSTGTGAPLSPAATRLTMTLKALSLARHWGAC